MSHWILKTNWQNCSFYFSFQIQACYQPVWPSSFCSASYPFWSSTSCWWPLFCRQERPLRNTQGWDPFSPLTVDFSMSVWERESKDFPPRLKVLRTCESCPGPGDKPSSWSLKQRVCVSTLWNNIAVVQSEKGVLGFSAEREVLEC